MKHLRLAYAGCIARTLNFKNQNIKSLNVTYDWMKGLSMKGFSAKMVHLVTLFAYLTLTFAPTVSFATQTVTEEVSESETLKVKLKNQGVGRTPKPLQNSDPLKVQFHIHQSTSDSVEFSFADGQDLVFDHFKVSADNIYTLQGQNFLTRIEHKGANVGFRFNLGRFGYFNYLWDKTATLEGNDQDHTSQKLDISTIIDLSLQKFNVDKITNRFGVVHLMEGFQAKRLTTKYSDIPVKIITDDNAVEVTPSSQNLCHTKIHSKKTQWVHIKNAGIISLLGDEVLVNNLANQIGQTKGRFLLENKNELSIFAQGRVMEFWRLLSRCYFNVENVIHWGIFQMPCVEYFGRDMPEQMCVIGNLEISPRHVIKSLNQLQNITVQKGSLRLSNMKIVERDNISLPNIERLEIRGKKAYFYGDLYLNALKMDVTHDVIFSQCNDKMSTVHMAQGDFDVTCAFFNGRCAKISGAKGRGIVHTTKNDIWLGGGVEFTGTSNRNEEGIALGYYGGRAANAYRSNGAYFKFSKEINLKSAASLFMTGLEIEGGEFMSLEAGQKIQALYSIIKGNRGGRFKAPRVHLKRTDMGKVTKPGTPPDKRSKAGRFVGKGKHKNNGTPSKDFSLVTSNPTVAQFLGDLELETQDFKLEGSQIEVSNNLFLNGIKQTLEDMNALLKPQVGSNGIANASLKIGDVVHIKSGLAAFEVNLSTYTIKAFFSGKALFQNTTGDQKFRDRKVAFHINIPQYYEQNYKSLGFRHLELEDNGSYKGGMGGGFYPNLPRTLTLSDSVNPFTSHPFNKLQNTNLDMLLMNIMAKELNRVYWIDENGRRISGIGAVKNLMDVGYKFEKRFYKATGRKPTIKDIEAHGFPMIYMSVDEGNNLLTNVYFPENAATRMIGNGLNSDHFNIEGMDDITLAGFMMMAENRSTIVSYKNVVLETLVKRLCEGENYKDIIGSLAGIRVFNSGFTVAAAENIVNLGADFYTTGVSQFDGQNIYDSAVFMESLNKVTTGKRKKKEVTITQTVKPFVSHYGGVQKEGNPTEDGEEARYVFTAREGNASFQAPKFDVPQTYETPKGKVSFQASEEHTHVTRQKTKKKFTHQTIKGSSEKHKVIHPVEFAEGAKPTIHAPKVEVEHRADGIPALLKEALKDHPNVFYKVLNDEHEFKKHKKQFMLSKEFTMILAAAISIATAGMGVGAGFAANAAAQVTANATMQVAIQAGIQAAICSTISHAVISTINNKGKLHKVGKEMVSKDYLLDLVETMTAAAITAGLMEKYKIPTAQTVKAGKSLTIADRIYGSLAHMAGATTAKVTVGGKSLKKSMVDGLQSGAGDVAQGFAAGEIKGMFSDEAIQKIARYAAHAAAGGVASTIRGHDTLSGAFGAAVGEVTADLFKAQLESSHGFGPHLSSYQKDVGVGLEVCRFITTTFAAIFGLDPAEAAHSAAIAARENSFAVSQKKKGQESKEQAEEQTEERGRSKEKRHFAARDDSPERIKDTAYEETTSTIQAEMAQWSQAIEKLNAGEFTLSNLGRATGHLGLEGIAGMDAGFNWITLGGWSFVQNSLDDAADIARTYTRRSARFCNFEQRTAQNLGDGVYVGLSLFGSKGLQSVSAATKAGKALKSASSAQKITKVKPPAPGMPVNKDIKAATTLTPAQAQMLDGLDLAGARVRKVNGRMPLNSSYAGKTYPQANLPGEIRATYPHGVPFNGYGYPDFSRYAIKKIDMNVTGNRAFDNRLANQLAGYKNTPMGYTWHHHQNGQTMMLVPKDLHDAVAHTGGVANLKKK